MNSLSDVLVHICSPTRLVMLLSSTVRDFEHVREARRTKRSNHHVRGVEQP